MSALAALNEPGDNTARHHDWDPVIAHAPQFAVTAWAYLDQLAVSMRPATVDVADNTLRCFARFLITEHPELGGFRHSDTVAITEKGIEIMTYYSRDLESLTIPV